MSFFKETDYSTRKHPSKILSPASQGLVERIINKAMLHIKRELSAVDKNGKPLSFKWHKTPCFNCTKHTQKSTVLHRATQFTII